MRAKQVAVLAALSFGFTVRNYGTGWIIDTRTAQSGEAIPVEDKVVKAIVADGSARYSEEPTFLQVTL